MDVWTISQAGLQKRLSCNSKPSTVQWVDDDKMFVGLENGNVVTFKVSETEAKTFPVHKQRVKCLYYENDRLYSASSAGELKVWSTTDDIIHEICSVNASCRITCVGLNRQSHSIKKEKNEIEREQNDENVSNKSNSDSEDLEDEEVKDSPPRKRKPGAFVSITYGNDNDDNGKPSSKKAKKKRKGKKSKNKKEN